jgi:hypothetical protein
LNRHVAIGEGLPLEESMRRAPELLRAAAARELMLHARGAGNS